MALQTLKLCLHDTEECKEYKENHSLTLVYTFDFILHVQN